MLLVTYLVVYRLAFYLVMLPKMDREEFAGQEIRVQLDPPSRASNPKVPSLCASPNLY